MSQILRDSRGRLFCCLLFAVLHLITSVERHIYLASTDIEWDYSPAGRNLVSSDQREAKVYLEQGSSRIGHKYKKTVFREYTDDTFNTAMSHPVQLGLLGPTIKMEVGDTMYVHFKNLASNGSYSVHPHGVLYNKANEGALYADGTESANKFDDSVTPGQTYHYKWQVTDEFSPLPDDPNCLTWTYHSHVHTARDTNTGLIGTLMTCRKGTLTSDGKRRDVDKDFPILFMVIDENQSTHLDENIRRYTGSSSVGFDKDDEEFQASNLMYAVNGFVYGALPGLDVCHGDLVSWHLFGLGNEVDVHNVYFHGQTLIDQHRRTDTISVFPAVFSTGEMVVTGVGNWLINCQMALHDAGGMQAILHVGDCKARTDRKFTTAIIRTYYIAAKEVNWNYGPSGRNKMDGSSLYKSDSTSAAYFTGGPKRVGGVYKKALYFEYTDETFSTEKPKDASLGFLGPVIRAEVGDVVEVVFKNLASRSYSIQPHGVHYNDTANNNTGQSTHNRHVSPNETFRYVWTVTEGVKPTASDPDCLTWIYSSAVDPFRDAYSGLIGPLLTCKKGTLNNKTGQQHSVDREYFLMFSIMDENWTWYLEDNIQQYCSDPGNVNREDGAFQESNKMHGINGLSYGNLEGLDTCIGDRVVWHVMAFGSETDLHTAYFRGQTFTLQHTHRDTVSLVPGSFQTLNMVPDNVGVWGIECKTDLHFTNGMRTVFNVSHCGSPGTVQSTEGAPTGTTERIHYIAAVEEEWDYAPDNINIISGEKLDEEGGEMEVFVKKSANLLGHKYKKALYREYTDNTFLKRKPHGMSLGMLGPLLKAEVGDQLKVVFKNMASRNYSIHPHGVMYSKMSEGASYHSDREGQTGQNGIVSPGQTFVYLWSVPPRAGPGTNESSCVTWVYYSAVNPPRDTNSGLVGPLVICRPGILRVGDMPEGVDKEFPVYFSVVDENKSWYLTDNIRTILKREPTKDLINDEEFQESNLMHTINGILSGQGQSLDMKQDERVNWYLLSLGSEVDMHTVHFHGQTVVRRTMSGHRMDTIDLFPGTFYTVEMKATNPGRWLLHCHVSDHFHGGMMALFTIRDASASTAVTLTTTVSCIIVSLKVWF